MWWNIQVQPNGHFDIWTDDDSERHIAARNLTELERQLAANGIVDRWYTDALTQLAKSKVARIQTPALGIFSQI